jgi:beta-mannanase
MSNKIFHVTVSPGHMTASQVAKGEFDEEYLEFFQFVKDKNIKTIFRTMHEMNGNRYPRAGTTYTFKRAWKHVWNLSREVGLDQSQILFDFSLNHRDKVMYNGTDMRCMLDDIRVGCKTWEDYYPGDTYVDIIGFTFYNRGKATSDRAWLRPKQILIDDGAGLLERLQAKKKPVFIDEVGTTKVRYNDQPYEFVRSQEVFWNDNKARKNLRLRRLKEFMDEQPWIKGMIYFNIDYTA